MRVDTRSLCAHGLDTLSNIGRDEALTERTHFRFGVALQLWPFVKLAPRSSRTSDVGTATRIFATSASVAVNTYHTRICSADVDDMEADHLDLDSHDLDDSGITFNSFSLGGSGAYSASTYASSASR